YADVPGVLGGVVGIDDDVFDVVMHVVVAAVDPGGAAVGADENTAAIGERGGAASAVGCDESSIIEDLNVERMALSARRVSEFCPVGGGTILQVGGAEDAAVCAVDDRGIHGVGIARIEFKIDDW